MTDRTPDLLARYWDALTTDADPSSVGLDPSLAQVIRHVSASDDVPGPDPTFLSTLKETLMDTYANLPTQPVPRTWSRAGVRPRRPAADTQSPGDPRSVPMTRFHWVHVLLSAALLLVTLGIAVETYWSHDRSGPSSSSGPAIQAPGAPSPTTSDNGLLLEIPVPSDVPVPEAIGNAGMGYYTMAPATTTSWAGNDRGSYAGIWVDYVVTGTLSITSADAVDVIRAGGGTSETMEAGTEITLAPGDTVIRRYDGGVEWVNLGSTEVGLVELSMWTGKILGPYFYPPEWHEVQLAGPLRSQLPDGAYLLRVAVMELEPNEVLPSPPAPGVQFGITTLPTLEGYLAESSNGKLTVRSASDTITAYTCTVEWTGASTASPEP